MVRFTFLLLFSIFTALAGFSEVYGSGRTFTINREKNSFYMNGKPFKYVSGSMHYFRVPHEYWRDRLRKFRAAGLNAISTYVEWSLHEPTKGHYNFKGDLNIKKFIRLAQEENLYVILRPGPYICAERDLGGLPYWLLKYPDIQLRTNDKNYKKHVEIWIDELMKKLSPLLYGNGGPIILVQVENEYGSYSKCDQNYLNWLRDLFKKHVKNHAVLFTTDGPKSMKCGNIKGVYATVDFGPGVNVTEAFEDQRKFESWGPLINSEYYPGWLTHWGEKEMQGRNTSDVIKTLKEMLDKNANVNFYMFYGGTNFGFTAGANFITKYQSDVTSYDYDAPITEAGDITDKYMAIRDIVFDYLGPTNVSINNTGKGSYGEIKLQKVATLFSPTIRQKLGILSQSEYPKSFEDLDHNHGYVLYETKIPENFSDSKDGKLVIKEIKDLAHIYRNGEIVGNMSREFEKNFLDIKNVTEKDTLSIVVENLGRINFGPYIHDRKGILSPVMLLKKELKQWNMTAFALNNVTAIKECYDEYKNNTNKSSQCNNGQGFAFFSTVFLLPEKTNKRKYVLDSFLDVSHLTKGLVFINGFNLGRYWSWRGPQYTIYVPGVYLKSYPEENFITVMEENIKTDYINIKFIDKPIFSKISYI